MRRIGSTYESQKALVGILWLEAAILLASDDLKDKHSKAEDIRFG